MSDQALLLSVMTTAGPLVLVPLVVLLLIPAAYFARLAHRRGTELDAAVLTLEDEIAVRADAERQLMTLAQSLEERVTERTAIAQRRAEELALANTRLTEEVAERRRAQEALTATKQLYQDLFDNSPDMYAVVDATSRRIVECNQTMVTETGYGRDELLGREVIDLYDLVWADDMKAAFEAFLQEGAIRDAELQLRRKDGAPLDVSLNISPIRDEHGNIVHSRLTWRDITERKRALETLAQQAQELRRSNAELEQVAYIAAHDLQEPLLMVTKYLRLIQRRYEGQLDSDADEFITFAVDGATRMHHLLNGLLNYSQVAGRDRTPVQCQDLLDHVLDRLADQVRTARAAVTIDPLPNVLANERELGLLFEHLVANALTFRGDRPARVHISAELERDAWRFAIGDNGLGIDPDHAERIFVLFHRLNKRREYPGTGIGLAICKKVVERHGGRIWVESTPGEGSAFFFTLPAASE